MFCYFLCEFYIDILIYNHKKRLSRILLLLRYHAMKVIPGQQKRISFRLKGKRACYWPLVYVVNIYNFNIYFHKILYASQLGVSTDCLKKATMATNLSAQDHIDGFKYLRPYLSRLKELNPDEGTQSRDRIFFTA